jgi:hypothetical protein
MFLVINYKVNPFAKSSLNWLEAISLISINLTVYCGLFFISARSEDGSNIKHKRFLIFLLVQLNVFSEWFLFLIIAISNSTFFVNISYFIFVDFRNNVRVKNKKVFVTLCYCCNKKKFEQKKYYFLKRDDFKQIRQQIINSIHF